jgi:hypothetical protein
MNEEEGRRTGPKKWAATQTLVMLLKENSILQSNKTIN